MTKCVFCGREESSFKGVHLIKNDGSVNFYCSSKCRKNSTKLNRDRKKLKWTQAFHDQRAHLAQQHVRSQEKAAAQQQANQSAEKPAKKATTAKAKK